MVSRVRRWEEKDESPSCTACFQMWGLGCELEGSECRVWALGLGFRVEGLGFRVEGMGCEL